MSQKVRCPWPGENPLYVAYHDLEWGVPEYDDRALYEKLVLDGFQAGLSWITILRKRENFRRAFDGFDPEKIASYGKRDFARLMKNEGIIRSNGKIKAAIKGAQLWLEIQEKEPGGFSHLIWKHVDGLPRQGHTTLDGLVDGRIVGRVLHVPGDEGRGALDGHGRGLV